MSWCARKCLIGDDGGHGGGGGGGGSSNSDRDSGGHGGVGGHCGHGQGGGYCGDGNGGGSHCDGGHGGHGHCNGGHDGGGGHSDGGHVGHCDGGGYGGGRGGSVTDFSLLTFFISLRPDDIEAQVFIPVNSLVPSYSKQFRLFIVSEILWVGSAFCVLCDENITKGGLVIWKQA